MHTDSLNNTAHFDNIDLMKALGIFFVIFYHSQLVNTDILHDPSAIAYINYMISPLLSTCVPLFLFANGWLLIGRDLNIRKHTMMIIRLIILTFVWGALNLICMMAVRGDWMSFKEFIKALWGWKHGWIHHMWYMGALVCVHLFFPLIKAAFDHHRKAFNFFVVVVFILTFGNKFLCMAATVIYHLFFGGQNYIALNFFNMFNPFRNLYGYAFSYFLLGCCMRGRRQYTDEWTRRSRFINPVSLMAFIIAACLLSGFWGIFCSRLTSQMWDLVMDSYDSVFTIICTICLYLLFFHYRGGRNIFSRFIRAASSNTLGIYLMHEIFLHLFKKAGINDLPFMPNIFSNILYSFLIMLLCLAISMVLGKIPVLRNLTGWHPHAGSKDA